jgi:hypothetical protein
VGNGDRVTHPAIAIGQARDFARDIGYGLPAHGGGTMRPYLSTLTIALFLLSPAARADVSAVPAGVACPTKATLMARLELLFGLSRKQAAPVSEEEWAGFVDAEVTPRFPDGLTILTGYGQWRDRAGAVVKETSKVLVIWYAPDQESDSRIEAIRDAYKKRFAQDSVLRVDGYSCVSF